MKCSLTPSSLRGAKHHQIRLWLCVNLCKEKYLALLSSFNLKSKKDALVAAVSSELLESDLEEEQESASSMWVVQVNRGGLYHVNDNTYLLFTK